MSEMENCGSCRFWTASRERSYAGYCRRYPPFSPVAWRVYAENAGKYSMEVESARFLNDAWPNTSADAWCGEFSSLPRLTDKGADNGE